jgi:hypothetical protein
MRVAFQVAGFLLAEECPPDAREVAEYAAIALELERLADRHGLTLAEFERGAYQQRQMVHNLEGDSV